NRVQAFIRLDAGQRHSAPRNRQLFEHWDATWRISGRNDERSGVLLNITELQHQGALAGSQTCFGEHTLSSQLLNNGVDRAGIELIRLRFVYLPLQFGVEQHDVALLLPLVNGFADALEEAWPGCFR